MTEIIIRPAIATDIDTIRRLYHDVEANGSPEWRTEDNSPYTDRWIEDVIEGGPDDQAILVATRNDEPVGYTWVLALVEFDTIEPRGHIAGVGVDESLRGQGVGAQLVAAAEDWCRTRGLPEVSLHCYMNNTGAHRLYERLGFQDEWIRMRKALD